MASSLRTPVCGGQQVRAPYTTAKFIGERIRPPSPAALLLVNAFLTYIVVAVCVCVLARASVLVRVLKCASECVRLCGIVVECVGARVSLCALMRFSAFVFIVRVVVHVCV